MDAVERPDEGLAPERTALAWNRTGIAFFVAIAALGRRVWPIDAGNHGWVVLTLGVAALGVLAGLLLAGRVRPHHRHAGQTIDDHAILLVSVSTFVLAIAAFALALFPA
jgi:putative membrane protein